MLYGDTKWESKNESNSPYYEDPCEFCKEKSCEGCEHAEQESCILDKFDIDDERYHQEFS